MFVPAAELSRAFYDEVVRPLLGDHRTAPRCDNEAAIETVQRSVSARLPDEFRSLPVRFGWDGVEATDHVTVTTVGRWRTAPKCTLFP